MIDISIDTRMDASIWDCLLEGSADGNIFQSSRWAAYLCARKSTSHYYLTARHNGRVVGSLLFSKDYAGSWRLARGPWPARALARRLFPLITWMEGPIIYDKENSGPILLSIVEAVRKFAAAQGLGRITGMTFPVEQSLKYKELIISNTSGRRMAFDGRATIMVNLEKTEVELWRALKSSAKKALAKCGEDGVSIRLAENDGDIERYVRMLKETRKRLGLPMPPLYPDEVMWNKLHKAGNMELFLAEKDGMFLAGLGLLIFNRRMMEIGSAQSTLSLRKRFYPNDAIKWAIIKWGAENKIRRYDLAGVATSPVDTKERGIRQFKEKWGGRYTEYAFVSDAGPGRSLRKAGG